MIRHIAINSQKSYEKMSLLLVWMIIFQWNSSFWIGYCKSLLHKWPTFFPRRGHKYGYYQIMHEWAMELIKHARKIKTKCTWVWNLFSPSPRLLTTVFRQSIMTKSTNLNIHYTTHTRVVCFLQAIHKQSCSLWWSPYHMSLIFDYEAISNMSKQKNIHWPNNQVLKQNCIFCIFSLFEEILLLRQFPTTKNKIILQPIHWT